MVVESITDSYTIDLQNTSGHYSVSVPQGDGRSRILKIYIENNHEPYILSDQNTYIFAGKNSSGQGVYIQCEVDVNDNALLISLSGAVLSNSGLGKYVILEYPPTYGTTSNDMAISTFPFNIHVVKSALDMNRMEESNQYQVLADLINKADKMNKWHVGDEDPPTTTENVKNGDYYLATNTGNIYIYEADSWSNTPVGNIKDKLYIRYSHNSNGSNMTIHPISRESDPSNYSRYIGIYSGIENSAPSYTRFDWILLGEGQKGDKGNKGDKGDQGNTGNTGPAGNGISSVSKTSTSGLVDTYTILYTNGTSSSFTVRNGQDGSGSGDMTKAIYDNNNVVLNAGGIDGYVGWKKRNYLKIPSNVVNTTINNVDFYINRNINGDVTSIETIGKTNSSSSELLIATATQDTIPAGAYYLSCGYFSYPEYTYIEVRAYNGNTLVRKIGLTNRADYMKIFVDYNGYTHIKFYICETSGMYYSYNIFYPMFLRKVVIDEYNLNSKYPFEPYYENIYEMIMDRETKQKIEIHHHSSKITINKSDIVKCSNNINIAVQFTVLQRCFPKEDLFCIPIPRLYNLNQNDDFTHVFNGVLNYSANNINCIVAYIYRSGIINVHEELLQDTTYTLYVNIAI